MTTQQGVRYRRWGSRKGRRRRRTGGTGKRKKAAGGGGRGTAEEEKKEKWLEEDLEKRCNEDKAEEDDGRQGGICPQNR